MDKLLGYKGSQNIDPGIVYSPYIPIYREKPILPLPRILYVRGIFLDYICKFCGSSLKRKWGIFPYKKSGCLQPLCKNHYDKSERFINQL